MTTSKKIKKLKIENFFSPRSPLEFVGFSTIGVLINLLSGANVYGFIGVIALLSIWWLGDIYRNQKKSRSLSFSVTKQSPKGARGLILLLSPYAIKNEELNAPDKLQTLIDYLLNTSADKLHDRDFQKIDLFNSNLLPQIKAVEYHWQQGKLDDVWLISSETSEKTALILKQYLCFHYGQTLHIHYQDLVVKSWDYGRLWELGEDIFRGSDYKDGLMVADITGGNKMMSVASAMVCIPPMRQMQYMDSQRDWQGNPLQAGEMKPVAIDINAILYASAQE